VYERRGPIYHTFGDVESKFDALRFECEAPDSKPTSSASIKRTKHRRLRRKPLSSTSKMRGPVSLVGRGRIPLPNAVKKCLRETYPCIARLFAL
jgi:hypothetical protein